MKRLFIANRGEIARRIAQSARLMGLEVVVITDRVHPPEFLAGLVTDFVNVDLESPSLYLNPQLMVDLAQQSGCDSLHPGFGFLSENSAFAAMVQNAGMIWVGPSPDAIMSMASKETARNRAVEVGVPVVPGLAGFSVAPAGQGDLKEIKILEDFAKKVGFPLLLKAAYGGGGKGMRRVQSIEELLPAAQRAASEALSSFGDSTLICERYIECPRHVEVQILGDHHGQVTTLGDRDCSIQRRHQKIIEEAPAPELNAATRIQLHQAAIRLAKSVNYSNAGTIEFLVDWSEESQLLEVTPFYFLEMNTRLQVEHPVTEEVYGVDLVEWQIRVARGEKLPPDLFDRPARGHSVEVRIYAEDPAQNFMPAPGILAHFEPATGRGIRWELGLDPTDTITGHFDPMIAKLITTATTRKDAIELSDEALRRTFLAGPANNTAFLRTLLGKSAFKDHPQSTGFLGTCGETLNRDTLLRKENLRPLAEEILAHLPLHQKPRGGYSGDNFETGETTAWSSSTLTAHIYQEAGYANTLPTPLLKTSQSLPKNQVIPDRITSLNPSVEICSKTSRSYRQDGLAYSIQYGMGHLLHDPKVASGKLLTFWYASLRDSQTHRYWIHLEGECYSREHQVHKRNIAQSVASDLSDREIQAPVPGKIVSIVAVEKKSFRAGTILLVLESMKMEFEIKAPQDLVIEKINAKPGDQVGSGQNLIEFLPWTD